MATVLIVVAHPDDAEIAMGMRIAEHVRSGDRVRVHCLTTGRPGDTVRQDECLRAGAVLGVEYSFSTIPDTRFTDHRGAINAALFTLFAEVRPDLVYTHYPDDQHLDHQITGSETTAVALRESQDLTYICSPYSQRFEPNLVFMGSSELLNAKMNALSCFRSQSQIDMDLYRQLAMIMHRRHVHHRVVERFPDATGAAELFVVARRIEFAANRIGQNRRASGSKAWPPVGTTIEAHHLS